MNKQVELFDRKSAFVSLNEYCVYSMGKRKGLDDSIEVTEWSNMDGVDIEIYNVDGNHKFRLTHGQFDALKACVEEINKSHNI